MNPRRSSIAALTRAIAASPRSCLLFLSHGYGGGVERHVRDLIALVRPYVDVLVLNGTLDYNVRISFHALDPQQDVSLEVGGFDEASRARWVDALCGLGLERVHLHHLHGWARPAIDELVLGLTGESGLPLDITFHDYSLLSPRFHLEDEKGRYAGLPLSPTDEASQRWRELGLRLLKAAARIIVPCEDVAKNLRLLAPNIRALVWPHPESTIDIPNVVKVGLIGGISEVKGFTPLCEVARAALAKGAPLVFRVIGHATRPLPAGITATGTYVDADLQRLLASERCDVFWFPSQVPETWNYALSAAMATGRPIVASALGSNPERLARYPHGRLVPFDAPSDVWIEALCSAAKPSALYRITTEAPGECSSPYANAYLMGEKNRSAHRKTAPNTSALCALLEYAPEPRVGPHHSLINLFRLGRYAGHTASAEVVEQQLSAISADETHLVGRKDFDAVSAHRGALLAERDELLTQRNELLTQRAELLTQRAELLTQRAELLTQRAELLTQRAELLATLERINAELLATSQHLMEVTRSRSWRWTRPLRGAHLGARLVKGLLAAPGRAPAALSALRHDGLRAAIEATHPTAEVEQQLVATTAAPDASPLASPPPHPITPALSAEFATAVRLFPERLKSPWWIGHIPFAYELIARHRPSTIVELGTYSGSSFAAFCQAMEAQRIEGTCHGVDLWEGDVHMGRFDESLFLEMSAFAESRYPKHARLVRKLFDEAVHDFADGSIDLLHIDGTHTYEAVRNDFETWLPKLSARGIVLFHDIHVTEENCGPSARKFGVRRLFDEVKVGRPHCEFLHCFGLGVLVVGKNVPAELLAFIERCRAPEVRSFFAALGDRVLERYRASGEPPPAHAEYGEDMRNTVIRLLPRSVVSPPPSVRAYALYFPQFHRIPENDAWWGEGFTDWDNVRRAQPLFPGHDQPRVPLGGNYYDQSKRETLAWQIDLAKRHGLSGFCHYHYWFDGKQLLNTPTDLVLADRSLDFPIALAWANETWSRRWDGQNHQILIEQTHRRDPALWMRHFEYLFRFWSDPRAIMIDGRPVFMVYRPHYIEASVLEEMFTLWRNEAHRRGLKGLYLVAIKQYEFPNPALISHFDAIMQFAPFEAMFSPTYHGPKGLEQERWLQPLRRLPERWQHTLRRWKDQAFPQRTEYDYESLWAHMLTRPSRELGKPAMPGAFMDWDNTARYKKRARLFLGASPERFRYWFSRLAEQVTSRPEPENLIWINAWNEWSEGTYLEPDERHGYAYIEAVRDALAAANGKAERVMAAGSEGEKNSSRARPGRGASEREAGHTS